jgi:uncharacterized membrane protein
MAIMYWNGHMTAAGWIIAVLWTVIMFALIAGGIYWFIGALSGRTDGEPRQAAGEGSAREILDKRLAKGELTIEQYEELRDTLDGGASPQPPVPPGHPAGAVG